MLIYNTVTGLCVAKVPKTQKIERLGLREHEGNLASLKLKFYPIDWKNYKVIDGELVRLSKQEIKDLSLYGRILTEEERQLQKLKPSLEEIRKAEQTIEILTLIQEVI